MDFRLLIVKRPCLKYLCHIFMQFKGKAVRWNEAWKLSFIEHLWGTLCPIRSTVVLDLIFSAFFCVYIKPVWSHQYFYQDWTLSMSNTNIPAGIHNPSIDLAPLLAALCVCLHIFDPSPDMDRCEERGGSRLSFNSSTFYGHLFKGRGKLSAQVPELVKIRFD